MTNFFTNLFGKNSSNFQPSIVQNEGVVVGEAPANLIPQNLFVDHQHPAAKPQNNSPVSELSRFLNADYFNSGYNDGYEYHSADLLKSRQDLMCTQFRMLIEKEIQKTKGELRAIEVNLAHLGEQFPGESAALKIVMAEKLDFISEYRRQFELSIEIEGLIAAPVFNFRNGFQCGISKYLDEQNYLKSFSIY